MRPITPQTGHTQQEVIDAMDSGQFVYADCYTIEPLVGIVMRYTTAQRRVTVQPLGEVMRQNFEANEILIKGLRVRNNLGVEVDEQSLTISYPSTPIYQNYLTWPFALMTGRLDGGHIKRDRFIAKEWGTGPGRRTDWLGGFPMFRGLISTINQVGRQSATIQVKSDLVLLNTQMPQFLWEPTCKNTWGDPICGVDQSDWSSIETIDAPPTRSIIPWSGADQNYNQGKIHIDNGDSVVRIRTISRVDAGNLYLSFPLDFDPFNGQQFTVYPGCPKTTDATYGCPKYHGVDWPKRFKGFPFTPVAETAL